MGRNPTLLFLIWISLVSTPVYSLDVLFIHSYHHQYPWVQEYYQAFQEELQTTSLKDFQMDSKRLPVSLYQEQTGRALDLIHQHQPRIVVVADDNALRLVGIQAVKLGYPVIFLGINSNPRHYLKVPARIAGVLERPLLFRSVIELKKIVPTLKKLLILMEKGATTDAILNLSFGGKSRIEMRGIEIVVKSASDFSHWQQLVRKSDTQGYDLIILGSYSRLLDDSGQHVPLNETAQWTNRNSKIPVFSYWRFSVGAGKAIGGLVVSGKHQGQGAAAIVNYYLNNLQFPEPAIRVQNTSRFVFSRTELNRWGLTLPDSIAAQAELID